MRSVKRHLKGQHQGIRSTKHKALEKIMENKTVMMKIEGKDSPFHHIQSTKTHEAFFRIEDCTKSIHTDHTGSLLLHFPTRQQI
jgi:hypothetical protein